MNHAQYMKLALQQAEKALDRGEFPVGCIFVCDGEVVAQGLRKNSRFFDDQTNANEMDHAEIVALRELIEARSGTDRSRTFLYSTMEPCLMCFSTLILNNIQTIIYAYEDVMGGGTNLPLQRLAPLYRQKKITVVPHILRQESLDLFKKFFSNSQNHYWQGSLLAEYTMEQP